MKFVITGEKVEGSERSILPEKSQRDNLKELATKGFAKEAVAKTLRYFKAQKNGNECVQATTSLIEYVNKGQEKRVTEFTFFGFCEELLPIHKKNSGNSKNMRN